VPRQELQLYLPLLVIGSMFALRWRRMIQPRRLRVATLWIGPTLTLVGIAALLAARPAPTFGHDLGLAAVALIGGAVGWTRARLSKVEFDADSETLTLRGTPYGILFLLGLIAARQGLRIVSVAHPELGIDLNRATDFLLFFAFGLVFGYAAEIYLASRRARQSGPAMQP
jgi:hypothetical protein